MRHEISLTGFTITNTGSIELDYDWNGYQNSVVYPTAGDLQSQNADILQDSADAVRWLVYYLLALGNTPETMQSQIGKKLVVEIGPAVQQSISLV